MAGTTGLEPATSAVTGQRSNQLSYVPESCCGISFGVLLRRRVMYEAHVPRMPERVLLYQKNIESREANGAFGQATNLCLVRCISDSPSAAVRVSSGPRV